jgi:hypothetical protein
MPRNGRKQLAFTRLRYREATELISRPTNMEAELPAHIHI